jgi:hypothetical protein
MDKPFGPGPNLKRLAEQVFSDMYSGMASSSHMKPTMRIFFAGMQEGIELAVRRPELVEPMLDVMNEFTGYDSPEHHEESKKVFDAMMRQAEENVRDGAPNLMDNVRAEKAKKKAASTSSTAMMVDAGIPRQKVECQCAGAEFGGHDADCPKREARPFA